MTHIRDIGATTSRRAFLTASALLTMGFAPSGCGSAAKEPTAALTVERWRRERAEWFSIAHRGCGDVRPEHTLPAYEQALAWGAQVLEISVCQTKDQVLVCHHDLTLERLTSLTGAVADRTYGEISAVPVVLPRLGPGWQGHGAVVIPRLDDVLDAVAGRAILCIEAKDNAAYPGMIAALRERDLLGSTIAKVHYASPRLAEAKAAGLPVFAYLGSMSEATPANVRLLGRTLDPHTDVMVLPTGKSETLIDDGLLREAVASGIPVWVFPVHRRWEVDHFRSRGAQAVVSSNIGYTSAAVPPARSATWADGKLASGQLTKDPASDAYALGWPEAGVVSLKVQGTQSFLTLGDLGPVALQGEPAYLSVEVRVDQMPADRDSNLTLAFGHVDDRYYEHRQGQLDGYHAMLRFSGGLELRRHRVGAAAGDLLGTAWCPAPKLGEWVGLRLALVGDRVTWSRTDTQSSVTATCAGNAGYLTIGRSSTDGVVSLRNISLS